MINENETLDYIAYFILDNLGLERFLLNQNLAQLPQ
jgi:hypothetical protein